MELNKYIDHTILNPDATEKQIKLVAKEARDYHFAAVMINPYWVSYVHKLLANSDVKIATVIGFPLGANTTSVKIAEAKQAIVDGADEVDMVMNIGEMKSNHNIKVKDDIRKVVETVHEAHKVIKVIIETALLSDEEIILATKIVADAGADFVKTSTGFSTSGATVHDVKLMNKVAGTRLKIKAAGGIHSASEAKSMIDAGASRLGTSSSIKIINEQN